MNERFVELAKLAGGNPNYSAFKGQWMPPPPSYIDPATVDLEKFAQLIVFECVGVMQYEAKEAREYFTYMGDDVPTSVLCNKIQEHFGIKE